MIQRPMPREDVVVEELGGDVCLYRPDIDEVVVLNSSAADIWRLADGSMTVAQIVERLAGFCGIPGSDIASDVQATVLDLGERGYLAEKPPPRSAEA